MRRFVIGDIHGCAKALRTVIETIQPDSDDEIVFVGDYIDRGPNSRDVVEQVIQLGSHCRTVTLRGNHEVMLQCVALMGLDDQVWLTNGGKTTVASYGGKLSKIPDSHMEFFQKLRPYYENNESIFVHASYDPVLEMHRQTEMTLYWEHLTPPLPNAHMSGKRVFVGHTPQPEGYLLDVGHLVCVDTYCFGGGYLTAYELGTRNIIQANKHGHLRRTPLSFAVDRAKRAAKAMTEMCRNVANRPGPETPHTKPDEA